ncbi:hypothetical protein KJZ71_02805 [Patescibacteria group bacterium]|uniref:Big-1 domain-containing protein n=1 Tax=candidate division WWE3 bacterium TaxID=2053526 RepID=A0A928Y4R6_UNCKA|nr:hypothetical protein [candidate division WWE3 bacterium]MCL4732710.1 hypothetical protein [Patescibacteria group bacterium]
MLKRLCVFVAAVCLAAPAFALAAQIDYQNSTVGIDKAEIEADGIEYAIVTVVLRDMNLGSVVGANVTLQSSRGSEDTITILNNVTDLFGRAKFKITSLKKGGSVFTAIVDGQALVRQAALSVSGGIAVALNDGDLIKIPDDGDPLTQSDTAVYYYAKDGKRYVFPNEKTYFTWYPSFSNVKIIPLDQMSLIPIGGNVTYRPGTRMLKFQTDVKTYVVSRGGILRWLKDESVAQGIFGANWNQYIDDIPESFYVNYEFGEPVANSLDYVPDIVRNSVQSIGVDKSIQ